MDKTSDDDLVLLSHIVRQLRPGAVTGSATLSEQNLDTFGEQQLQHHAPEKPVAPTVVLESSDDDEIVFLGSVVKIPSEPIPTSSAATKPHHQPTLLLKPPATRFPGRLTPKARLELVDEMHEFLRGVLRCYVSNRRRDELMPLNKHESRAQNAKAHASSREVHQWLHDEANRKVVERLWWIHDSHNAGLPAPAPALVRNMADKVVGAHWRPLWETQEGKDLVGLLKGLKVDTTNFR